MLEVAQFRREDLAGVVQSVFATMMGLEASHSEAPCPPFPGMLTGAVYLTGPWHGAACVHLQPEQACAFAARFLGIPAPDAVDDDVRDVIGELANMIAGNLKCALASGVRVSIPSVTEGTNYALRMCGARVICQTGFATEEGPCWITLVDAPEQN